MYTSFSVKKFRGLKDLTIEPLARVNLIAGENNVAKTTLSEALWIHHAPNIPNTGLRVNRFRGVAIDPQEVLPELFPSLDTNLEIELSSSDKESEGSRRLRIYLRERDTTEFVIGSESDEEPLSREASSVAADISQQEIIYKYTDATDQELKSSGWCFGNQLSPGVVNVGFQSSREKMREQQIGTFLAARTRSPVGEDVGRYSKLQEAKQEKDIATILKAVDPRFRDLVVLVRNGVPTFYVDMGGEHLLPFSLMGDGVGHLLSIALAVANAKHGIVMVDEIENGLHYSVMADVWRAIAKLAHEFDVQLFATAHGLACVRAAQQAFAESTGDDFRFHRLERVKDKIEAITADQETLGTALEAGWEVR